MLLQGSSLLLAEAEMPSGVSFMPAFVLGSSDPFMNQNISHADVQAQGEDENRNDLGVFHLFPSKRERGFQGASPPPVSSTVKGETRAMTCFGGWEEMMSPSPKV